MPRIRTIKPEFFSSRTTGRLCDTDQITFVGLWTYVDDNGVGVDSVELLQAALRPWDPDPLEARERISGALRRITGVQLIHRYTDGDRPLLYVTGWNEHQRISHPRAPRYPKPDGCLTCTHDQSLARPQDRPPVILQSPPEERQSPPEILVPEQGAGIRDQGSSVAAPATTIQGGLFPFAVPDEPAPLASAPPASGPSPVQVIVGGFVDAMTAKGGIPTQAYVKAIGANAKRLLEKDGLDPAVVLLAAERAGAVRSRDIDRFLGEAHQLFDRKGEARQQMFDRWEVLAREATARKAAS